MSRSDDVSPGPAWASWLVALAVMAVALGWVGSQAMDEPLYVAGSSVVTRMVTPRDAIRPGHDGDHTHGRALAMAQPR